MEITREQKALAAQVTLPMTPLPSTPGRCPAWIEPDRSECKLPAVEGLLCGRHHREAQKKLAALRKTIPHPWKQDPMTDHPLTPERIVTFREEHVDSYAYAQAIFDAGREHERTTTEGDRPWEPLDDSNLKTIENACLDDVLGGEHLTWTRTKELGGVIITERREGIAEFLDDDGDWHAEGSGWITDGEGEGITLTIHRPAVPELPTKCGTVIVANDGHKFIKAEVDGIAHRAREAVLGANGWWYGAWRKAEGDGLLSAMFPEHISAPTWKVDDR